MTGIIKTDQIQGAGSSTITIPTGNTLAVTDNATIGGTLGVTDSATAGNLAVATDTLNTDATNKRVGVGGVTAPTTRLDVGGTNAITALTLRSGDNSSASNGANQVVLGYSGSTSYAHAVSTTHHAGQEALNAINLDVWKLGRGATNIGNHRVASFDAVGVNFPNQPFVTFQGNSNGNTTVGNGDRFGATDDGLPAFNTAPQKGGIQGITYTSATGRFTVPTAGRYLIFFQGYYNGGAAQCRIASYINGVQMNMDHNNSIVGTLQLHYLGNMSANDYIDFRQISGGNQDWYHGVNHMLGYITLLN